METDEVTGSTCIITAGAISNEWNDVWVSGREVPDLSKIKALDRYHPRLRAAWFLDPSFGARAFLAASAG